MVHIYHFYRIFLWGIPTQIDLAVTWNIFIFIPCTHCRASQKGTAHGVLDFMKQFLGSVSPKRTWKNKTDNDTVGRYRFGANLHSESYVRKHIFWVMGVSGCSFGLKVTRKSKLKKKNIENESYCTRWFAIFCTVLVTVFYTLLFFFLIEFTVRISSKSIPSNSVIFGFFCYFGWYWRQNIFQKSKTSCTVFLWDVLQDMTSKKKIKISEGHS